MSLESPIGPPTTKRPVGLMKYFVFALTIFAGRIGLTTSSMTASLSVLYFTSSLCWVDRTTASMPSARSSDE